MGNTPSTAAARCKTRPTFGKAKVPPKSLKAGKNVRLTNLRVTGNGRANDQNYQYKQARLRMCG